MTENIEVRDIEYLVTHSEPKNFTFVSGSTFLFPPAIPERWTNYVYNALVDWMNFEDLTLTERNLLDEPTSDLSAKLVRSIPQIRTLCLVISDRTKLDNIDGLLEAIKQTKTLKTLKVELYGDRNPDVLKHIGKAVIENRSLSSVIIMGDSASKEAIDECIIPIFQQSKSVTTLNFSYMYEMEDRCDWSKFEEVLSTDSAIKELYMGIDSCSIDVDLMLVKILRKNKSLRNLSMNNKVVENDEKFSKLCEMLSVNKTVDLIELRSVNTDENSFEKIQRLFQIIKDRNVPIEFTFYYVSFNIETTELFLDLIEHNLVKVLHLHTYNFNLPDNRRLFAALKKNTVMEKITFEEVTWETDQPAYIADYVRSAKKLKYLHLCGSAIYSEANLLRLLDGIDANANLQHVILGMVEHMGKELFEFMAQNKTIKKLDLPALRFDSTDLDSFSKFLTRNDTLLDLQCGNEIDEISEVNEVLPALEKNWTLTKLTGLKGLENNVIKRNRKHFGDMKSNAIILAHNIMRSNEAKNLLPVEIWQLIFSHLKYPGVGPCGPLTQKIFAPV